MSDLSIIDAGAFTGVLIAAGFIFRELWRFTEKVLDRRKAEAPVSAEGDKLLKLTSDLWEWHNVRDENGLPLWYARRETLARLADSNEEQLKQLTKLNAIIDRLIDAVNKLT